MSAEDAELEAELRQQLQEQIEGLAEVEEALHAAPDDPDLLELKSQLEESIVQFRDSLQEVQQHILHQQQPYPTVQDQQQQQHQQQQDASWDQHLTQQQDHVRPRWLLPGVGCRFRFSDGQWHPGVVHEWLPQQAQPVSVHFAYPTRQYMLQEVTLPLGLVQPLDPSADPGNSSSSSSKQLCVGSRVLVLPRGSWLWQPGEVLTVQQQQQPAAAAAASDTVSPADASAAGSDAGSTACMYTVQLVGQQRILTVNSECIVAAERAAAVGSPDQHIADPDTAAAAAAAAGANSMSITGDGSDSGSDMSCSSGEGVSGGETDDEASEDSASEVGERRLGAAGTRFGSTDVLDHARAAVEAGVQSESVTFAAWEDSGRGIASKLMARMGFKRGAGLGRQGAGIKDPLDIVVLPSKKGLGAAAKHKTHKAAGTGSHSSKHHGKISGRKRKRMKAAAERHAAKAQDRQRQAQREAATGEQGLFAFINDSLGHGSEAAAKLQAAGVYGPDDNQRAGPRQQSSGGAALAAAAAAAGGGSSKGGSQQQQQKQQQQKQKQPDRKGLVGSGDDLAALKAQVTQLTAMLERNKANKGLAPQIQSRLAQAKQAYEVASAQHKQLHKSVAAKEATKKWMKF